MIMSKTSKMLYASFLLSAICGVFLGLVRGEVLFASPYPAFYISVAVVTILLALSSYFTSVSYISENKKELTIHTIPEDWSQRYNKRIQVIQLIGAFLLLMASVKIIASAGSVLNFISAVFSFACAVSLFFRIKAKDTTENTALLSLFPVFYLCFYLLMFYRSTARFPNLNQFGPQILTLACLVVTAYFNSASKFTKRPAFLRYFSSLCAATLALGDLLAYIFNKITLSITEPTVYLPTIAGFTIYYVVSLLLPPIRVLRADDGK